MQGNFMNPPLNLSVIRPGQGVPPRIAQLVQQQAGQGIQPVIQRQGSQPDTQQHHPEQQQQQPPPHLHSQQVQTSGKPSTAIPANVNLNGNSDANSGQHYLMPTQYNTTMWQNQMLSLPLVASHPNTGLGANFPMSFDQRAQMGGGQNGTAEVDQMDGTLAGYGMNADDLWARLQTFYEPTPSYWGQSVGGVGVGVGGYVDYSGMAMGM